MSLPSRSDALDLLKNHVKEEYQILHAMMVACAMDSYAKIYAPSDSDLWYITGLLHDIDYYEFPTEHPAKSIEWFKKWGYPEDLIHAVEAHAFGYNGFTTEPKNTLAAALMASDEMSGLIYAYSLMRPEGMKGMEAKGVKKRMKDKHFAAKINRDEINHAVSELSKFTEGKVDLDNHISLLIKTFEQMPEFI